MNKYKMQYVLDVITRDGEWLAHLMDAEDPDDILRWYDLYDILRPVERHLVLNELDEMAVAKQFKERHQLVMRA